MGATVPTLGPGVTTRIARVGPRHSWRRRFRAVVGRRRGGGTSARPWALATWVLAAWVLTAGIFAAGIFIAAAVVAATVVVAPAAAVVAASVVVARSAVRSAMWMCRCDAGAERPECQGDEHGAKQDADSGK